VFQYNELVQRAKPVIVISTHEIVRIHTMVEKHLAKLAPDSDDNLRVIMKDLGAVPPLPSTEKDIQLWLSNRFKADVPEVCVLGFLLQSPLESDFVLFLFARIPRRRSFTTPPRSLFFLFFVRCRSSSRFAS
jgi:hypothetical protein